MQKEVRTVSMKVVLKFSKELADKPVVCHVVKEYHLDFNILKANITEKEEGVLVLELSGKDTDLNKAIDYLNGIGVRVQPLKKEVVLNADRCTQCGACVSICPQHAFVVEPSTRRVSFHPDRCIACELCVKACPVRAIETNFK